MCEAPRLMQQAKENRSLPALGKENNGVCLQSMELIQTAFLKQQGKSAFGANEEGAFPNMRITSLLGKRQNVQPAPGAVSESLSGMEERSREAGQLTGRTCPLLGLGLWAPCLGSRRQVGPARPLSVCRGGVGVPAGTQQAACPMSGLGRGMWTLLFLHPQRVFCRSRFHGSAAHGCSAPNRVTSRGRSRPGCQCRPLHARPVSSAAQPTAQACLLCPGRRGMSG